MVAPSGQDRTIAQQLALIKELARQAIVIPPVFIDINGNLLAGLLLSQLIYWTRKNEEREGEDFGRVAWSEYPGWFFVRLPKLCEDLRMGKHEIEAARKLLRGNGFIEESVKGVPPTLWLRVNMLAVLTEANLVLAKKRGINYPKTGKSTPEETGNQLSENRKIDSPQNLQSLDEKPENHPPKTGKSYKEEDTNLTSTNNKPSDSRGSPGLEEESKPDPRIRLLVDAVNVCLPSGSKLFMDGADGTAAKRFFQSRGRDVTGDQILLWVAYRFGSDPEGTNPAAPIREWVGKLDSFQSGPRNKFGKPKYSQPQLHPEQTLAWIKRKLSQPLAQQTPLGDPPPAIKVPSNFQTSAGELLWSAIVEVASRETHRNGHERWLRPTKGLGIWRGLLFVRVPTAEFKPNLEKLNELFTREIDGSPVQAIAFLTAEEFESYRFQEAAGA